MKKERLSLVSALINKQATDNKSLHRSAEQRLLYSVCPLNSALSLAVSRSVDYAVWCLSFDSDRIMIKNFYIVIGICFFASTIFLVAACSTSNSSAQTTNQNPDVPALVEVDRPNPVLNERVYKAKTSILNEGLLKNLECKNQNGYKLVEVENYREDEGITSRDLDIVVGDQVVIKIELPTSEVKNFGLNSAKKTKNGFQMNTEWGGGNFHYEIQFSFICRENNFYLYQVKKDSFSTTNPDSGNYLDKKETETTKPNLPIEKFVISDYL